jgi:hypothetical protein
VRVCVPDSPPFTAAHHTALSFPVYGSMYGVLNRIVRDSTYCAVIMGILKVYWLSFTFNPVKSMVLKLHF